MNRIQKISFYSFLALALIGAYWAYQQFRTQKVSSLKAIEGIPDSCLFFFKVDEFNEVNNTFQNNSLVWQELKQFSALKPFQNYLSLLDSVARQNESLQNLLKKQTLYIAVYNTGHFLCTFNLNNLDEAALVNTWWKDELNGTTYKLFTKVQEGVVVIANSESLVNRFFNLQQAKLYTNKHFKQFYETNRYKGLALFCNDGEKRSLLSKSYSQFSSTPEFLFMNGVFECDSADFLNTLKQQDSRPINFLNKIPLVCTQFEAWTWNDLQYSFGNAARRKNNWWQRINDSCLFNAQKQFYESIEGTLINVQMPGKHQAVILPLKDTALFEELRPFLFDSIVSGIVPIKRLVSQEASFVQSSFSGLSCNELMYAVVLEKDLLLTNTIEDAQIFINARSNGSSLLLNPSFAEFAEEHLDGEFNYMRYTLLHKQEKSLLPFSQFVRGSELQKLNNLNHYALVAKADNQRFNYRLSINYYQENSLEEPSLLWTFKADTSIFTPPYLFKNHNTGDNELVFQDEDKTLYLQSAAGKLIWKKKLNEKLQSRIYIVDAFKKNKFQMLFNTANYIHLIDRNGNYVQGYPVRLPTRTAGAINVLSYEGKNDLRMFVACDNNTIYNYSIWGIQQEGFKPFKTSDKVNLPIFYCRVGASDYLITADVKGQVYAFSRKGDGRIDFKTKLPAALDKLMLLEGNQLQNTKLIYNHNGKFMSLSLSDKKDVIFESEADKEVVYDFEDVNNDKRADIIWKTNSGIHVTAANGSSIDKLIITDEISGKKLEAFIKGEQVCYMVYDADASQASVIGNSLRARLKFTSSQQPLVSDLFRNDKLYLIGVAQKELKAYTLK